MSTDPFTTANAALTALVKGAFTTRPLPVVHWGIDLNSMDIADYPRVVMIVPISGDFSEQLTYPRPTAGSGVVQTSTWSWGMDVRVAVSGTAEDQIYAVGKTLHELYDALKGQDLIPDLGSSLRLINYMTPLGLSPDPEKTRNSVHVFRQTWDMFVGPIE